MENALAIETHLPSRTLLPLRALAIRVTRIDFARREVRTLLNSHYLSFVRFLLFSIAPFLMIFAASWTARGQAAAPGTDQCVDSYTNAQLVRRAGRLLQARSELLTCVQDSCPDAVRGDCATWLSEIESEIPTLILEVRDKGLDVARARVRIDGREREIAFDGKAMEIDPGSHELVVQHDGMTRTKKVVVRAGDKLRSVQFEFRPAPGTPGGKQEPNFIGPAVLGGIGLAALGGFTYFAVTGSAREGDIEDSPCAATLTCNPDDVDDVTTRYLAADILLGVGAASLVAGGIWLGVELGTFSDDDDGEETPSATRPTSSTERRSPRGNSLRSPMVSDVSLGLGPGALSVRGRLW